MTPLFIVNGATPEGLILSFIIIILIPAIIIETILLKNIIKKNWGKLSKLDNIIKVVSLLTIIFLTIYPIFSILVFFINTELDGTREKVPCISCTANLKFIGLSLKQYAMDNCAMGVNAVM